MIKIGDLYTVEESCTIYQNGYNEYTAEYSSGDDIVEILKFNQILLIIGETWSSFKILYKNKVGFLDKREIGVPEGVFVNSNQKELF